MKIVCAWCGKILREDSEEKISHAICRECYDREVRPFLEAQAEAKAGKAFKPPPPEFDWLDFLHRQMSLSLAVGCAFFLVLLAPKVSTGHWRHPPSLIQRIVDADLHHSQHSGRGGR